MRVRHSLYSLQFASNAVRREVAIVSFASVPNVSMRIVFQNADLAVSLPLVFNLLPQYETNLWVFFDPSLCPYPL
jgi:hypothetical protein